MGCLEIRKWSDVFQRVVDPFEINFFYHGGSLSKPQSSIEGSNGHLSLKGILLFFSNPLLIDIPPIQSTLGISVRVLILSVEDHSRILFLGLPDGLES